MACRSALRCRRPAAAACATPAAAAVRYQRVHGGWDGHGRQVVGAACSSSAVARAGGTLRAFVRLRQPQQCPLVHAKRGGTAPSRTASRAAVCSRTPCGRVRAAAAGGGLWGLAPRVVDGDADMGGGRQVQHRRQAGRLGWRRRACWRVCRGGRRTRAPRGPPRHHQRLRAVFTSAGSPARRWSARVCVLCCRCRVGGGVCPLGLRLSSPQAASPRRLGLLHGL